MALQLTPFALLGVGAAVLSLGVAVVAYRSREAIAIRPFVGLMLALGGWSLVYAIQLARPSLGWQLVWQQLGLAIGGTIPTLWFVFTLAYIDKGDWLTFRRRVLLGLDPVVFAALSITNGWHGLVWHEATLVPGVPRVIELSLGIGYYVHIVYAYLLVGSGLAMLLLFYARASPLYRWPTAALILGAIPPFVANIAFTLGVNWGPLPPLDLTPFAFVVTGALFGLALYQFDLLERAPIARRQMLDEMGDGLLVVDQDGIIVDVNPMASEILDVSLSIGEPIGNGVTEATGVDLADLDALQGSTITRSVNGGDRTYDVDVSSLTDDHGQVVGSLIALRDVTDRKQSEQRLEVAQRVLRHNLRNEMQFVRGWAEELTDGNGNQRAARRIIETTDGLIELTEQLQQMAAIEQYQSGEPQRIQVAESLESIVTEFQTGHPDVKLTTEIEGGVEAVLPAGELLEIAVRNLIENAIEHNDAENPAVDVRLAKVDTGLRIEIADNGPGIPAYEREVLEAATESQLHHGSGIGLWLVYWSTKAMNGELIFEQRDSRGSIVIMKLPQTPDRS